MRRMRRMSLRIRTMRKRMRRIGGMRRMRRMSKHMKLAGWLVEKGPAGSEQKVMDL